MAIQYAKFLLDGLKATNKSLTQFKDLSSKMKEAGEKLSKQDDVTENEKLEPLEKIEKTDDNKENLEALKDSSNKIEGLEEKIDDGTIKAVDAPELNNVVTEIIDNLTTIFNDLSDATKGITDKGNEVLGMVDNLLQRAIDVKEKLESLTGSANSNFDLTDPESDDEDFDMDGDGE